MPRTVRQRSNPFVSICAATFGMVTILVAASLFLRATNAPALSRGELHLAAQPDRLAVLDGDTLRLGREVVRLEGIAAPDRNTNCLAGKSAVDCGAAATNALAQLVRDNTVECAVHGHDQIGRPVATCVAGGVRLSDAMVLNGWAHARGPALREAEDAARASARGIWQSGS